MKNDYSNIINQIDRFNLTYSLDYFRKYKLSEFLNFSRDYGIIIDGSLCADTLSDTVSKHNSDVSVMGNSVINYSTIDSLLGSISSYINIDYLNEYTYPYLIKSLHALDLLSIKGLLNESNKNLLREKINSKIEC